MRLFFIILVLVAITFGAVVVYGVRHKESPEAGKSGSGAPRASGGKLDEDDLEDWEPPNLGPLATLSGKFGPSIKLDPARVELSENGTADVSVPAKDEKVRIARITLESGRLVQVTARHNGGEDDDVTCLCGPKGAPVAIGMFQGCPPRWVAQQQREGCEDKASLPFGPEGGTIVLRAPAPVTIATR